MGVVDMVWVTAFVGGMAAFLSPCFFPLLPIYVSYLVGTEQAGRCRTLLHSIAFVFGFGAVFALYGVGIGLLGNVFRPNIDTIRVVSGVMLIAFGTVMLEMYRFIPGLGTALRAREFSMPSWMRVKPNMVTSIALGVMFACAWTPCVGPILGSILTLAYSFESTGQSTLLLALYAAGLGVPFVLVAVFLDLVRTQFEAIRRWTRIIQIFSAVALIAIGLTLVTDTFRLFFLFGQ